MVDDREHPSASVPPPLVALAGWLVPGAGYWLIGHRVRAVTVGVTILAVFTLGILISGIRVVQAPDMTAPGNLLQKVLTRPWFIGQVLTGPVGIAAAWISDQLAQSPAYHAIEAKARLHYCCCASRESCAGVGREHLLFLFIST